MGGNMRRAVSLFDVGELYVTDSDVINLVVSLLEPESDTPLLGRALDALCAVAWPDQPELLDAAGPRPQSLSSADYYAPLVAPVHAAAHVARC
jgi:hypothetical protein